MLIYHEQQEGALCGVHCLNALLQAPMFTELDLADIARALDALEAEVLGAGEAIEGHGNLDDSGMFSSQVLARALEAARLEIVPYRSPAAAGAPGFDAPKEAAYVCNLMEHWFALRRFDGEGGDGGSGSGGGSGGGGGGWWNLNSILPAPEPLSDFYLAAYLDSLLDRGYTIYVVRGQLPPPQPPPGAGAGEAATAAGGRWFTPEEARAATAAAAAARQRGKALGTVEAALARAAEAGGAITLQPRKRGAAAMGAGGRSGGGFGDDSDGGGGGGFGDDDDPELAAALAASLAEAGGGGNGGGGGSGGHDAGGGGGGEYEDDDPELAAALAASLQDAAAAAAGPSSAGAGQQSAAAAAAAAAAAEEEAVPIPEEPAAGEPGAISVGLRLPDRVATRRWRGTDTVAHLRAYAAQQLGGGATGGGVALATQFPRRVLDDGDAELRAAGIDDRSVLVVTRR